MGTDNSPEEFQYISNRLVREIVQQHEAAKPHRAVSATVNVKVVGVQFGSRPPDYDNPFDLARRATEAVRDNTGTLQSAGEYIRAELDLTPTHFPVLEGWRDIISGAIAAFFADETTDECGRMFIGLFGSITNFIGRRPEESRPGWTPSSARGLYEILDSVLEAADPPLAYGYVRDDADADDKARAESAMMMCHHIAKRFPQERLAFLAKVHRYLHDIDGDRYDTVFIGAPIWVATPPPVALS
jgi:hypothetical protein